jgi:hypothetical protein
MSRIKVSKTVSSHEESQQKKEWPAVVYLWAFGLAITGYTLARVGLSGLPHPYHWTTGLIGGILGILVGWAWHRWRGDVI